MAEPVVITGFGALTPLGDDAPSTWTHLVEGQSGVTPIEADWIADYPVRFAAQVKLDLAAELGAVRARRLDRCTQLALVALHEAWSTAGLEGVVLDPNRVGVAIGTGIGGIHTTCDQWDEIRDRGPRRASPWAVPMLMANAPAAQIGLEISARGGVHTTVSACASANEAFALGLNQLRCGSTDVMVLGGAEAAIHGLPLAAFAKMGALSRRNDDPQCASRPWDVDRDGFVLGEGAVVCVAETLSHARGRGARILGTLAGAGISADSYDVVQPDPSGSGQQLAMQRALSDATLSPWEICHINAHATSTPAGDLTEAQAIRAVFGSATDRIVVTSTKSATGHLLGAAGALEGLATVAALYHRTVPPTINLDNPEPGLPIDVATAPRRLPDGRLAALSNSFGFGGHNVAVVFTNDFATDSPSAR